MTAVKEARELTGIEVLERSLVGKPANRRKFICYKSDEEKENPMPDDGWDEEAQTQIEDALNTPADGEAEVIEKAASAKAMNAVKGALRILNSVKDELPEDVFAKLAEMAGEETKGKTKTKGKAAEKQAAKIEPKVETKAKADPPAAEVPEMVLAIAKSADTPDEGKAIVDAYRAAPDIADVFVKGMAKADARIAQLEGITGELNAERDRVKCAEVVKSLDLPGDTQEQIDFIRGLSADQRGKFSAMMKPTSEVARKAMTALGQPSGSDAVAPGGNGSAYSEALKLARQHIEKTDGKVSETDALVQVFHENPDLYERHRRESYAERSV